MLCCTRIILWGKVKTLPCSRFLQNWSRSFRKPFSQQAKNISVLYSILYWNSNFGVIELIANVCLIWIIGKSKKSGTMGWACNIGQSMSETMQEIQNEHWGPSVLKSSKVSTVNIYFIFWSPDQSRSNQFSCTIELLEARKPLYFQLFTGHLPPNGFDANNKSPHPTPHTHSVNNT